MSEGGGFAKADDSSRCGCTLDSRFRHVVLVLVLVLAAGAGGCSLGSWQEYSSRIPGPDAEDAAVVTQQDAGEPVEGGLSMAFACEVLNQAKCQRLASCGLLPADGGVRACVLAEQRLSCGPTTWPSHVAVGSLRYDGMAAQACAEGWRRLSCRDFAQAPAACAQMLVPNAGSQQRCYDGYEECRVGVCRGSVCPRLCQALGIAGDVCTFDSDCQTGLGLFCQLSTTTAGVGRCAPLSQLDQACDDVTPCWAGLTCIANQCKRLPLTGSACLSGACDDGCVCVSTSDGGLCMDRKGLGEACAAGQCKDLLVCASGRCEPKVLSDAGEPCALEQTCPAETACVGVSASERGVCRAPMSEGAACVSHGDCADDLACVQHDGGRSCAPRQPVGAPCDSPRVCQLDALCIRGSCSRAPLVWEPCSETGQCGEGTCVATDGGFVCAPLKGSVAPCRQNSECASGACISGACRAACVP